LQPRGFLYFMMLLKYMYIFVATSYPSFSCCTTDYTWPFAPSVLQFNRKPAKGVEYLLSNKLIENKASSVAQFLKSNSSLNKVILRNLMISVKLHLLVRTMG
jgi:hypothetical protein